MPPPDNVNQSEARTILINIIKIMPVHILVIYIENVIYVVFI